MIRKLSAGEIALCEDVFKNAFDPRSVTIMGRSKLSNASYVLGNHIHIGGGLEKEDLIGPDHKNPFDYGNATEVTELLHELVHVWQSNVGIGLIGGRMRATRDGRQKRRAAGVRRRDVVTGALTREERKAQRQAWRDLKHDSVYGYHPSEGRDLLDFNIEQQGDIIADYYATKLWGWSDKMMSYHKITAPEAEALEPILARFKLNPRYPLYLRD